MFIFTACNADQRQRPVFDYAISNPAETGGRYPYLHSDDGETVFMSWLGRIDEGMFALEYASYNEGEWEDPELIHVGPDFFTNWADFPSIISLNQKPAAAHWLKKIDGGHYAYDIQISFPEEDGRQWNHITPHNDETPTEHGFVSMIPADDGSVLAIWLDGRQTVNREHDKYENMDMAMTLRSAVIYHDGRIENRRLIDEAVCDCCQTDLISVDGGAVAVYRDRLEGEIRDISLSRYDLETGEWSEPVIVHDDGWQISGCPVNGPRAAENGDQIAVAWYTESENENGKVLAAFSENGGESFESPITLNIGTAMGRVDIDAAPDGSFYVSWMERGENLAWIYLQKIESGALTSDPVVIGSTGRESKSGFPRITALNEGVMLAWTQTEPFYRIRTAFYNYQQETQIED
jgi:hypothetical protein